MIILFKIILFLPKENLRNKHNHKAKTVVTLLMPLNHFCLNFATGTSIKMSAKLRQKVTAALPVQECFREVICPKLKWKREYRR